MNSLFDLLDTLPKPMQRVQVKTRIQHLVPEAFRCLERNLYAIDEKVQVSAAVAILDRAGYGPQSKVTIDETREDLSSLTNEELAARAQKIVRQLQTNAVDDGPFEETEESVH